MAFNNQFAGVWLASGESTSWWYSYGEGHGLQIAAANPLSPDGQMEATGQGVEFNDNGTTTYTVWVRNNGPQACFHNLNGGGVV